MRVYLVGRLAADVVVADGACALALATGRCAGRVEQHVVHVVGPAAGGCRGLRRDEAVAVEGKVVGEGRVLAARVRRLRAF